MRDQLPRGLGWLIKLLPEANAFGSQLQTLLSEPEMAALLKAAPQAGRILRPLCQMLAIPAPPHCSRATSPHQAAPDAALPPMVDTAEPAIAPPAETGIPPIQTGQAVGPADVQPDTLHAPATIAPATIAPATGPPERFWAWNL